MKVAERKDEDVFELWVWLILAAFVIVGAVLFFFEEGWLPASIPLAGALIWAIASFRIVPPAFAGLVIRLGSRVVISETVQYFRMVDGQKQDISADEFNSANFDLKPPDIIREVVSTEYLTKKEGWTLIFPILERLVRISLRQNREEINSQEADEPDEAYEKRAESFTTAEAVHLFAEIFYSYKITDPGKVFELEGGINEKGESPFLIKTLHDFAIGGIRGVAGKMPIKDILTREIKIDGGIVPIGEKIREDITSTPNFPRLGAELLILRVEDIKFKKDSYDVRDALEAIKRQELQRESDVIDADAKLQMQFKDSARLVNRSEAELAESRNKALAANAEIAAFVGKKMGEPTTAEDGEKYAKYQIGLRVAKSLETGTKVIIPAGDVSKVMAGLVNVFDASKSN